MAGRRANAHPPVRPTPPAPTEPAGLSDREAAIFRDLVAAVDVDHFTEADLPLLVSYCQTVALHENAMAGIRRDGPLRQDGKTSAWLTVLEKCQRGMVALSMRLRLSPQARRERAVVPRRLNWEDRRRLEQEGEDE